MAKNEFCNKKGKFSDFLGVIEQFFLFHACAQAKNLDFLRIYFDLSLSFSFFPLSFFFVSSLLANFIV